MARGESQTLLIWAIIFLVLALIMAIVTLFMRSKYTETASQLADAQTQIRQLNTENGTLKTEGGKLRELVGYADAAMPVADIETSFADHLKNFAPTVPSEGASYLTTLKTLGDSYKSQIDENLALQRRNMDQSVQLAAQAEKERVLVAEFEAKTDQQQRDMKAMQDHFASEQEKTLALSRSIAEDRDKTAEHAKVAIASSNEQRDIANMTRDKVMAINTDLAGTVAGMESPIPTYTDAEIMWVSADSRHVRINLGSNHGLRPRMPFSVYAPDEDKISVDSSKGKIEVIRVDANTAEARVTEDILINPIIPGDKIYTPVWKPGQRIRFALMNGLDLDGDKIPDPQKVIELIHACGGDIDSFIDDLTGPMVNEGGHMRREAYLVGEITKETRYLVTGDRADDPSETLSEAIRIMKEEAEAYGLIEISLKDLLNLMGQRPQSQTVGFGERNRAINNYEMEPDVVNQRMPGRVFHKYEDPDAQPATTVKPPVSPLFNQRPITNATGTASPLFQPRSAKVKDAEN